MENNSYAKIYLSRTYHILIYSINVTQATFLKILSNNINLHFKQLFLPQHFYWLLRSDKTIFKNKPKEQGICNAEIYIFLNYFSICICHIKVAKLFVAFIFNKVSSLLTFNERGTFTNNTFSRLFLYFS